MTRRKKEVAEHGRVDRNPVSAAVRGCGELVAHPLPAWRRHQRRQHGQRLAAGKHATAERCQPVQAVQVESSAQPPVVSQPLRQAFPAAGLPRHEDGAQPNHPARRAGGQGQRRGAASPQVALGAFGAGAF